MSARLSHLNDKGEARMVDVSAKAATERVAVAEGFVAMALATLDLILDGKAEKGDVLATARIAGIMAAKRTSELIPLCHPLLISGVNVEALIDTKQGGVRITASVKTTGQTGVEMEALTAVSVACLTLYDMLKSVDKSMTIENIVLKTKTGGASGNYRRTDIDGNKR